MLAVPSIYETNSEVRDCEFYIYPPSDAPKIKRSDLFLNIPASTDAEPNDWRHAEGRERGWLAVRNTLDRHWFVIDAMYYYPSDTQVYVEGNTSEPCDAIAIGVDPRMKREDIDGAIHIYKNEKNTGWLFAHATVEEHHERILLAETAIATVFDELAYGRLSRTLTLIVANKPSNQQLGALTILEHINSFKHDCMRMARYREGQLHIGQHVKEPGRHYIYKMVEEAFALAKKKWTAEKSAELNQISDHIAPIEKRLKSRHSFKRRWEIPTVFPNASASD